MTWVNVVITLRLVLALIVGVVTLIVPSLILHFADISNILQFLYVWAAVFGWWQVMFRLVVLVSGVLPPAHVFDPLWTVIARGDKTRALAIYNALNYTIRYSNTGLILKEKIDEL